MPTEKPSQPPDNAEQTLFGENAEMSAALAGVREAAKKEAAAQEAAKSPEQKRQEQIEEKRRTLYRAMHALHEKLEEKYRIDLQTAAKEETLQERREREGGLSREYSERQMIVTSELAQGAKKAAAWLYPHLETLRVGLQELYKAPQVASAEQIFTTIRALRVYPSFQKTEKSPDANFPLNAVAQKLAEFLEITKS